MGEKATFKSTKEVYGVDPKVLANLTYLEATKLKLEYGKKQHKELSDILMEFYKDGGASYEEISAINYKIKKLDKAIKLAETQLAEIT